MARIKNEKVSKPLLKKITWEEVKLVSVGVGHDEKAKTLIRIFFGGGGHSNQLSFALDIIDPGISLHESFKVAITYP